MDNMKYVRPYKRRPPSEKVKQNRTKAVNVCSTRKIGCSTLSLLRSDEARRSKRLQGSGEIAGFIEPFRQPKVADHRLAVFIQKYVSRLKIAMENSLAMSVSDGARNLGYHSHTLARVLSELRCRGT